MNKKQFMRCTALPVTLFCSALAISPFTAVDAKADTHKVQQTGSVTGLVVDNNGEPIIGASVKVVGTNTGAVTDFDGNFKLANVQRGATLEITYIGYLTQRVKVAGSSVKVVLLEDTKALDEVVVVGYGVQRKSDVTGALTRVGEKELNAKPVNNAFEALQGKAAGVDITSSQRPGTA